jgi:thymidine kinase
MKTRETELLARIDQAFPEDLISRYHELIEKRRAGTIDSDEYEELLRLTDEVEFLNAQRIEQIAELATLRGVSLSDVMKQLGKPR